MSYHVRIGEFREMDVVESHPDVTLRVRRIGFQSPGEFLDRHPFRSLEVLHDRSPVSRHRKCCTPLVSGDMLGWVHRFVDWDDDQ